MQPLERQGNVVHKKDYSEEIKQIIQNVSASERFQLKLIVFFLLVGFFCNLQLNSSHLIYMNPAFHCEGQEDKVKEVDACKKIAFCKIVNEQTLTAELQLYCDSKEDDRVFIQSAGGMGNWGGILFSTLLSDRFGRKFCLCITMSLLTIGCILQYIGGVNNIPNLLFASQFIYGFGCKSVYVSFLLLSTRFLKKRHYEMVTLSWFIVGVGITNIFIACIDFFLNSWRALFFVYFAGFVVLALISFVLLKQDPIFYFDCGNYQQCKEVITAVSNQNDADLAVLSQNLKEIDELIDAKAKGNLYAEKKISDFSLIELLRCDIILGALIMGLIGLFYAMANSSIDLSIQNLKLSYDINLLVIAFSNIIGYLSAMFLIQKESQRKNGFLFTSFVCGAAGMMFAFDYCSNNAAISTILIGVMKISLCWIGGFYVRLKVDLFPQRYQGTIVGVIEFIAGFGKTLGPKIIQLSSNNSINPIFSVNLLRLTFGTLPIFFLSQQKINLAALTKKEQKKQQEKQ